MHANWFTVQLENESSLSGTLLAGKKWTNANISCFLIACLLDLQINSWKTGCPNNMWNWSDLVLLTLTMEFDRIRKGKACARPENEEGTGERCPPRDLYEPPFPIPAERLNRPLIRPLCLEPNSNPQPPHPPVTIPPPPAKHVEREKFFKENKLHSRNPSSSRSESLDFSEWCGFQASGFAYLVWPCFSSW